MADVSTNRVMTSQAVSRLDDYTSGGGGVAVEVAGQIGGPAIIELIASAGLRGRGGGGFPTATKWSTVAENASTALPSTVVVNGAEGEPGSFKDRYLLLSNPYKVLEGAAVAAIAIGADTVVVCTKESFVPVVNRVRSAMEEMRAHPVFREVNFEIVEGPDSYLLGEETALLEVVEGRPPFPRVSPPWRHGVYDDPSSPGAAATDMAGSDEGTAAAPVLVNNVETFAHVTDIMARSPEWFCELGTGGDIGSGTFLCTVTGATAEHRVMEFPVGVTLRDVLETVGTPTEGYPAAVLPGVSHPLVPESDFDRPLGYGANSIPIGSGAFRFIAESDDPLAIAAGVSRFLAVESCGQCTPCKQDGLAISARLDEALEQNGLDSSESELTVFVDRVAEGARCALARQHEAIVDAVLRDFPVKTKDRGQPAEPFPILPMLGIEGGVAVEDESQLDKQPDWTREEPWSGSTPVELTNSVSV